MGKVIASITTSVDGYVAGPDDHPGQGLGRGGERLHYWVMGGPWTYEDEHGMGMQGVDREFFDTMVEGFGAGVCGRGMYDAAGAWGGTNPFPGPMVVLTHRVEDQPPVETGFHFVSGFDHALDAALQEAGDGKVSLGGGADLIRQGLASGRVDELVVSVAPVILGGGKRLFEGFEDDVDLEVVQVYNSPYATHLHYRVVRREA